MNAKLLWLIFLLWSASWAMAEPFQVSSLNSSFSIVGTFSGDYRTNWQQTNGLTREVLRVSLDKGEIFRSPHCTNFPKRRVLYFYAFLGTREPEQKNFTILASSQKIEIDEILDLGESVIHSDKLILEILIDEISPDQLQKAWLGFSIASLVEDDPKDRMGTCYAHMDTLLFSTESSNINVRRRARVSAPVAP